MVARIEQAEDVATQIIGLIVTTAIVDYGLLTSSIHLKLDPVKNRQLYLKRRI
jgi:hypothetical protein|tara:strand:- start:225 stop:383 length:159 start_codon:yes stop_codon:yes gene_type:complete